MRTTRPTTLVSIAVVAVALGWTIVRVWSTRNGLPQIPHLAPFALLLLAAVLVGGALLMRRRVHVRRPGTPPVAPDLAVRLLVLAQASSIVGALVAGGYLGAAVFYAEDLAVPFRRESASWSVAATVAALVVIVAAMWLERECRVPTDDDNDGQPAGA